jgi:hypothetical protein
MPKLNDLQVVTDDVIVIWDGLTNPETNQQGKVQHHLSVAFQANSPVHAELEQLLQSELLTGDFKGNLPAGAKWGIADVDTSKIPELAGWKKANIGTYTGQPTCVDENGQKINPTMLAGLLRAGSRVKLIAHAYTYNAMGNQGVKLGLDGVQCLGAGMELSVSAGMSADQVGAAFGGQPMGTVAGVQPMPQGVVQQGAAPTPAAPTPAAPTPAAPTPVQGFAQGAPAVPAPTPVEKSYNVNGQVYTESALRTGGYTDAHFAQMTPVA